MRTLIVLSILVFGYACAYHGGQKVPARVLKQIVVNARKITKEREQNGYASIQQYLNVTKGFAMKIVETGKYLCARIQTYYYYKDNNAYPMLIESDGESKDEEDCQFKMTQVEEPWVNIQMLKDSTFVAK